MRIGLQLEHFDPARGGTETYTYRFVDYLLRHGHEVHLFAADWTDEPAGVHLHCVSPYGPNEVRQAASTVNLDVLIGTGKSLGMDLFQPHGGTYRGSLRQNVQRLQNPLLRWLQARCAWLPKRRALLKLEHRQFTQSDPAPHFIAISRMVQDDMRRFYDVPDERLHLVYHGVDTNRFHPDRCAKRRQAMRQKWGLSPQTVCFLLVAHNLRLKGTWQLLQATRELARSHRDFALVIVGRGKSWPYRQWARYWGCADRVRFVGPMQAIENAYAAADVYVHPAWYEPFGLVVLEALACGLPVITTPFTGAGELMTDGREGYIIDTPAVTEMLADRMKTLLDPQLRTRFGKSARALAEGYSEDTNFARVLAICQQARSGRTVQPTQAA